MEVAVLVDPFLTTTPAPVHAVVMEVVGDDRLQDLALIKEEEAAGSFVP